MNSGESNLARIKQIHSVRPYATSLLNSGALADGIEWWAAGSPDQLPWAGTFHAVEGVKLFFTILGQHMHYAQFEPREYIAQGESVVAIIAASGHAIATERPFSSEIVRIYTFNNGKITRIRNYYDTAA